MFDFRNSFTSLLPVIWVSLLSFSFFDSGDMSFVICLYVMSIFLIKTGVKTTAIMSFVLISLSIFMNTFSDYLNQHRHVYDAILWGTGLLFLVSFFLMRRNGQAAVPSYFSWKRRLTVCCASLAVVFITDIIINSPTLSLETTHITAVTLMQYVAVAMLLAGSAYTVLFTLAVYVLIPRMKLVRKYLLEMIAPAILSSGGGIWFAKCISDNYNMQADGLVIMLILPFTVFFSFFIVSSLLISVRMLFDPSLTTKKTNVLKEDKMHISEVE